jgi:hypothetical protein
MVESYKERCCGEARIQSAGSSFALLGTASMSPASASVTTSALGGRQLWHALHLFEPAM